MSFVFTVLLAVLLAACAPAATPEAMMEKEATTTSEAMMDKDTTATPDAMMDKDVTATPEGMADKDDMMESPAWFSTTLAEARTGETFTIADFKGKVVLVETMAVWCSNCLKQQGQVKALHELLGMREDFVSLGLDIDPNEDTAQLKAFIDSNGFDWMYAVAPAEVSAELSGLYGAQFLNPPSTPMLIIDRQGEAHPLPFGIKSTEELLDALQPYLDEGL
jgi:peroxiredoxin